jgi:hypothetical protein
MGKELNEIKEKDKIIISARKLYNSLYCLSKYNKEILLDYANFVLEHKELPHLQQYNKKVFIFKESEILSARNISIKFIEDKINNSLKSPKSAEEKSNFLEILEELEKMKDYESKM